MRFMSGEIHGHSGRRIPLQSRNILVLLELWHGSKFCIKVYPFWRNTKHSQGISLSWIISLWYFALSMLPFTFLWKDWPLLLMALQICTLAGNFTVVWINLAWFFTLCLRQYDNGVDCYDCEIQTNVNALCVHRMDISLCMILPHDITLKELEHA